MLTISLDEYGNFESPNPGRCMVAGLIYEDKTGTDKNNELNRIQRFLRKACSDCSADYPDALHYNYKSGPDNNHAICDQVKNHIAGIFRDFLCSARGNYYIYAVVSEKDGMSVFRDPNESNLLRDNYAGNKYLHMTQMAVRNLLVNNPIVQDTSYHLEFATRLLSTAKSADLQSQARELGLSSTRDAAGKPLMDKYSLTDVNSYIPTLSSAILENHRRDLNVTLRVKSIKYDCTGDAGRMNGFLYLADIVCSLLQADVRNSNGHTAQQVLDRANTFTSHNHNMVWCYDDVDNLLRTAQQNRLSGNLLESLNALYDIKSGTTPQAKFYSRVWLPIEQRQLLQNVTPAILEQAARDLADYLKKSDPSPVRAWFAAEQLEDLLDRHPAPEFRGSRYWLYSTLVKLCNHRGQSQKTKEYYRKAIANASAAPLEDYLELRNDYSVILTDQLAYEEALENTKQTLIYEELAEELRREVSDSQDPASPHLGRTLSQLGQCHAFLQEHEQAQDCFRQALEKFGENDIDRQITRSYLLHSYIESGSQEEYLELCREYFGCDTLRCQLDQIQKMPHTSVKYALFVLVKGWHRFQNEKLTPKETRSLLNRILRTRQDRTEHPWELICKYCSLIANEKQLSDVVDNAKEGIKTVAARNHSTLLADICQDALGAADGKAPQHPQLTYMYR